MQGRLPLETPGSGDFVVGGAPFGGGGAPGGLPLGSPGTGGFAAGGTANGTRFGGGAPGGPPLGGPGADALGGIANGSPALGSPGTELLGITTGTAQGKLPLTDVPQDPADRGHLPLGDLPGEDFDPPAESPADRAARRTRVTLATPEPRAVDLDDDDVRVYSAPPIGGLGGFTIGSVPASVTPPKTWRKAAWFATGASGAVVVGLLCAGSFLVGKPSMDQAVQGAWPGYQGAPTVVDPTGDLQPPSEGGSGGGPDRSSRPAVTAGTADSGGGAGPVDGVAPPPAEHTPGPDATTAPGTATPTGAPQKPPITPAQRETQAKAPWWYSFPPDPQTMGDNSEKFFNTVTTDPAAASSVTTGDLHDRGPQALAERYAGIAYFEVKKISIDQQRGVTVNTVEVTHTDGTKTIEQRTLTFGDGDKITADGQ
ncbi:hypothetical protein ABJI51_27930 [Amycolatopsis sp. NEAU-NG30]|uniref:Uncharacterized protein n=1 Tax=Amycolatopsis melonis TaxID=3156488 RepID=A0ABV0LL50_9PSEU